ncbi:MAG: hypothetical protein SFW67_00850 [Myxococcaceae bacterium]|nr:hypothetical protein [Myxococcaceae bacterium]
MMGLTLTAVLTVAGTHTVDAGVDATAARLEALSAQLARTQAELERTKADLDERLSALADEQAAQQVEARALRQNEQEVREKAVSLSGYLDVGFFVVQGNGAGVRKDVSRVVSGTDDVLSTWVLRGDPFNTAINSRGEPADLGDSRAIGFDGLRTGGRPTVLVNALNLQLSASLDDTWSVFAMVDLLPRERTITRFALGDFLDVKQAFGRYQRRFGFGALSVWAGKVDSVLGFEYRVQESPERLTVSPSLLCRYTCGRALGVRARALVWGDRLEVLAAVTNGSNQLEVMPWGGDGSFNATPTVSGRVGLLLPLFGSAELSLNGMVGVQERQADPTVLQFHAGATGRIDFGAVVLTAEGGFGRAAGRAGLLDGESVPCAAASCLTYQSAHLVGGVRVARWLMPYARVDWRNGTMRQARDWAYASTTVRVTAGARVQAASRLVLKAEYTHNRELVGPDFPDDVFTTSFVVSY